MRADASPSIGVGHVMRCLALAQAWQEVGGKAFLASHQLPVKLADRFASEGVTLLNINAPPGEPSDADHCLGYANDLQADWVTLDGYGFSVEYQRRIKSSGRRTMVADDFQYSDAWCADVVFNQNLHALGYRYEGCEHRLLGPRYALLRQEFTSTAPSPIVGGARKRVLVTLGGGDPGPLAALLLEALQRVETAIEVRFIMGPSAPHAETILPISQAEPHPVTLLHDVQDMPAQYRWADFVIGAAGSSCWEWIYFSRPAAVVCLAENQFPIAESLAEHGLAVSLGWHEELDRDVVTQQLNEALDSSSAATGEPIVDGHGALRTARRLMEISRSIH